MLGDRHITPSVFAPRAQSSSRSSSNSLAGRASVDCVRVFRNEALDGPFSKRVTLGIGFVDGADVGVRHVAVGAFQRVVVLPKFIVWCVAYDRSDGTNNAMFDRRKQVLVMTKCVCADRSSVVV